MDQAKDAKYQAYLKAEAQKQIKKVANQAAGSAELRTLLKLESRIRQIVKDSTFTEDVECADMLRDSDMIRITCSRIQNPVMYVWNEKTLLWELTEGLPRVNRVINSLLVPRLRNKIKAAYRAIDKVTLEYQFADQATQNTLTTCLLNARDDLKKAEKKVRSLGSAGKLQSIFKVCGHCVGTESEFNQKLVDENLLPIKKNVINLETLEIRPRTKEDMFNFSLNVDFTEDTKDAEDFLREYCPKGDEDTFKYLMDCLSYMIAGGLKEVPHILGTVRRQWEVCLDEDR